MNEHFHTYMHTRTTGSNPTIVCEFYAGIRNRRSPFHRAHIHHSAYVYTWETLRQ